MACAADGAEVVAVNIDGSVHCWNLSDGQKRWKQRPLEYPLAASVVYAGDGARVIVGYRTADAPASHQLFSWDAATGAARSRLEGHTAPISALAANGGSSLLSGDLAGSLRRWELRSCEPTWELFVPAIDLLAQQQALAEPHPIHVNQRHANQRHGDQQHGAGRRSRQ
jgi:WD40 repeat protein